MFTNFYTTLNGQRHIARSLEDGKKLVLTRSAFGKGVLPSGMYPVSAEELVAKLGEMLFKVKEASDNEYKITTNFSNNINGRILPAFHLTEMGIYGKIENGDGSTDADYPEKLLFYGCCSESEADYIPNVLTEFIINWSVAIAGEATIESTIDESLVYASQKEMEALDMATFEGFHRIPGDSYSGPSGKYGIEVGRIEGRSEQEGTPMPDAPIEIKSFGDNGANFSSHGYQLFDANKITPQTSGGAKVANKGDGSISVYGMGTIDASLITSYTISNEQFKQLFKAGVVNIDCGAKTRPTLFIRISRQVNDSGMRQNVVEWNNASASKGSFRITEDMLNDASTEMRISMEASTGNTIVAGTIKPMMYQTGDGTWEPYKNPDSVTLPSALRSLPNGVCDTYEDGVITRRVGSVTIKATADWKTSVSYENTYYVAKPSGAAKESVALCNRYRYTYIGSDPSQDKVIFTGDFFNFKDSSFASLDAFKAWVSENPITVLYELESEETEKVDSLTLQSWAPHTSAHHDSEVNPTSIEWRISNQTAPIESHPIGSVLITSTNRNPGLTLGGEWECFDKALAYKLYDHSVNTDITIFEPSANTTLKYAYVAVEGHTAIFKIGLTYNGSSATDGESISALGNFQYSELGFTHLSFSPTFVGYSDDGDTAVCFELNYQQGGLGCMDTVPKKDGGMLEKGDAITATVTAPVPTGAMIDTCCDKFYWRRIG